MFKLNEKLKEAQARVKPEKLAISTGIAGISIFTIIPLQSVITYALHEAGKDNPTETIKLFAIALIGIANAASIAVETKTLERKEYSASPLGTTAKIATDNSLVASISGHALNFMQAYGINPVHAFNIASAASGDGGRLFFENASAVAVSLALWNIGFNTLILKDTAGKVINKIRKKQL